MVARSILARRLRQSGIQRVFYRAVSTSQVPQKLTENSPTSSTPSQSPNPPPQRSWLTEKVRASPTAKKLFLGLATLMGYNTPKQVAARRSLAMYEKVCVPKADEEQEFWQQDCRLPPTFQSWFTVTNLHVWLLTVRLRNLPESQGKYYIQSLLDHFFIDVEWRVRAVLQPSVRQRVAEAGLPSYTTTSFYTIPNNGKQPRGDAPERLVTRQMKIFKEQWAGMGMAFDLGIVRGDAELAAAVWRNFLGARGARGIVYPTSTNKPTFRRSVNLVGGEIEKISELDKKGLEAEEARDDGSGVHDFSPDEAGLYVQYPEIMADIVRYMRKELVRLENIPDSQILGKNGESVQLLQFGKIRD
ncbi:hypothetical protein BDY19DRAFT_892805 [Irpex rosettiformis]|uniref:Uncharacterized protein n=1 Tax=Irpex rosettiformis TaxID=378272 RepID=A0ACB8TZU7_9APHY|nr:hypothetical protein BDY19DRAFT_892805 [Irpex rosettiformis]